MKKVVTLVIVLVLLLAVAPWGIGRVAEKRLNAGLDKLVEEAPYLTIVERKWTSGWFRSEQEVTFELVGDPTRAIPGESAEARKSANTVEDGGEALQPVADETAEAADEEIPAEENPGEKAPATPLRVTVRNEVLHGPVLWPASFGLARVNTRLVLDEELRLKMVEVFGSDDAYRISTRVGFLGGASTNFSGEGRSFKVKDEGQVKYDAFNFDAEYSKNFDHISMNGTWPRFEASGKDGARFLIRGVRFEGQSQRVRGELYDTDASFVIDEFSVGGKEQGETSVANIHYVITSTLAGDFMDVDAKLGSGKVTNPQFQAMQLQLNEVHYDFTLRHLHADALDKLVTAFKASYKAPVADAAVLGAVWSEPFKAHGFELLKHDPEFVIDRVGVVTPDGDGVLKGVIKLPGVTAEELEIGAMALVGRIDADITIEIAQKLLEKVPDMAAGAAKMVEQGYARPEGDKLVCHIEFRNGELKVNGKAQMLPGMGGPPPQAEAPPEK